MAFWKKGTEATSAETTLVVKDPDPVVSSSAPRPPSGEEELLRRFGRVRSALSVGTVIQGRLSFDAPIRFDGKLSGEVYSSQIVIVGPQGVVEADVEVNTLIVLGTVKGKITVKERIEILGSGVVDGTISCPILVVEEGATLLASCSMGLKPVKTNSNPDRKVTKSGQTVGTAPASVH